MGDLIYVIDLAFGSLFEDTEQLSDEKRKCSKDHPTEEIWIDSTPKVLDVSDGVPPNTAVEPQPNRCGNRRRHQETCRIIIVTPLPVD